MKFFSAFPRLFLSLTLICNFSFSQDYYPVYNFGEDGVEIFDLVPPVSADFIDCSTRDDNGNYYLAGYIDHPQPGSGGNAWLSVLRVLPNGQRDTTFGINGVAKVDIPIYTQEQITGLCLQPDGKVLFAGKVYKSTSMQDAIIGRLLSNGQIDSSFNGVGYRVYNYSNQNDIFTGLAVQSDGKIVAAGYAATSTSYYHALVSRFLSDGSFDNTFATNGRLIYTDDGYGEKAIIQPDGKIVIAGQIRQGYYKMFMSRILTDGTLDFTFGVNGIHRSAPYSATNNISDFKILPNDGFIAIGYGRNTGANYLESKLFQIRSDGVLDTNYYDDGYATIYGSADWFYELKSIYLRADSSCLLAGLGQNMQTGDLKGVFCEVSASGEVNLGIGDNGIVGYDTPQFREQFVFIYEETDGVVCVGGQDDYPYNGLGNYLITKKRYCAPSYSSITISTCDSYTAGDSTFTESGIYSVPLRNANSTGCDSIVTLNLTINVTSSSVDVVECDSYTWAENGQTYTTSGSYPVILQGANAAGCDSIVTLNLTIFDTESSLDVTECVSYTWSENGQTYSNSGSYSVILPGAAINGCDSVVTLNLTITNPTSSILNVLECDSYTWTENGQTYTTSGSYSVTLPGANAAGCDSTITLNLILHEFSGSIDTQIACGSYTWIDGNTYTTSTSTPVWHYTNSNGCDSSVILNLTINPLPLAIITESEDLTLTASVGDSYQWINCSNLLPISGSTSQIFNPQVNGNYAVIISNNSGCSDTSDCVLINNLGIEEPTSELIVLYPNPANGKVRILMGSPIAEIVILNQQGEILDAMCITNEEEISLANYTTGIYLIQIITDKETKSLLLTKY